MQMIRSYIYRSSLMKWKMNGHKILDELQFSDVKLKPKNLRDSMSGDDA